MINKIYLHGYVGKYRKLFVNKKPIVITLNQILIISPAF